jgi:dihydroxy-acid dehydratase
VEATELARRAALRATGEPQAERGYRRLFLQAVTQADQGVDFDFLRGTGATVTVPRG